MESRVPAWCARLIAFVIGISRRTARRIASGGVTLVTGAGAVCAVHAASNSPPRPESREPRTRKLSPSRVRAQTPRYYIMMGFLGDRLRDWLGSRLGIYKIRGFTVVVENTRPDIATPDVLSRLEESLAMIERHQPWRLRHLRRDLKQIRVIRFPSRGAYFAAERACMVELTFLNRRDIGPATIASTIVHEGMHARVHRMGVKDVNRDRAHEERICRRAELEFGQSLPAQDGAPVIERALASLQLEDQDVAPEIDWNEAMRRQSAIDRRAT